MEKKGEEEDYLPQNDEFIPPTNFAVIENGLYRSTCIISLSYTGAFPVKRNFAFLRHLGIRSILFALLRVLTPSVLVPEEYPEDSLKFLKRCNIRLFKYPLEGNKVALRIHAFHRTGTVYRDSQGNGGGHDEYHIGYSLCVQFMNRYPQPSSLDPLQQRESLLVVLLSCVASYWICCGLHSESRVEGGE